MVRELPMHSSSSSMQNLTLVPCCFRLITCLLPACSGYVHGLECIFVWSDSENSEKMGLVVARASLIGLVQKIGSQQWNL
jgi:hypothetical protein